MACPIGRGRIPIAPPDILGQHAHSEEPCEDSRWNAVDLACRTDDDHDERIVRTKLVRGGASAAVGVSEAIGRTVLEVLGLKVAEAFSVRVSDEFARQLEEQYGFERVHSGRHWGTGTLTDALNVELHPELVEDMAEPKDLFTLYLGDVILGTPDRNTSGNVLFSTDVQGEGLALIPIDQSDCFRHPPTLRNREALRDCRDRTVADHPAGMERVVYEAGRQFLEEEFQRVSARGEEVVDCVAEPHEEWYERSGASPDALSEFLEYRVDNLEELARMDHWRGIADFTGGAHVLQL